MHEQGFEITQECTIPSSGVRLVYYATETESGGLIFEIADLLEPGQYERIQNIASTAKIWDGGERVIEVDR